MTKLADAVAQRQARSSAAKRILESDESWRQADPYAPATKEGGKYRFSMQLRLNEWEAGALAWCARRAGRSQHAQIRQILRDALLECVESKK